MSLSSVRPLLHLALCVIRADGLQHYDMSGGAKDQTVGTGCGKMGVSVHSFGETCEGDLLGYSLSVLRI